MENYATTSAMKKTNYSFPIITKEEWQWWRDTELTAGDCDMRGAELEDFLDKIETVLNQYWDNFEDAICIQID